MACLLNDAQLEHWIEQHGQVPQGYGEFAAFLHRCDQEYQASMDSLRQKLADPKAMKLYFVPGIGLSDVPF